MRRGKKDRQTGYHLGAGIEAFSSGQEVYYYQQDEQLSAAFITRKNGAVHNSYQYDAFGNELETAGQLPNRIHYTRQHYDDATGQYYLRARYYNPVLGRFMQEDTYQGDGLNLYAYCKNNPVTYYDPSGYCGENSGIIAGDTADFYVTPEGAVIPQAYYHSLSDLEVREWYLLQEATIPNLIDYNQPLKQQAYQAFSLRNMFRTAAREMMVNRKTAESLYKTDPNLTWEQIVQKQVGKGLTGDAIYESIIQSSQRSSSCNPLVKEEKRACLYSVRLLESVIPIQAKIHVLWTSSPQQLFFRILNDNKITS